MTRSLRLAGLALTGTLLATGVLPAATVSAAPARPAAAARAAADPAPAHPLTAAQRTARARQLARARAARLRAAKLKAARERAARERAARSASTSSAAPVVLSPFEARLVALVNGARAQAGLRPLTVAAGTTDVARRWSLQLARNGGLSHNPRLTSDLAAAGSSGWTFLAENVGAGPADQPELLFTAYMNSEHHRDNILDPKAVYLGMGTVQVPGVDGDTAWNTMDFADAYSTSYGSTHTGPVAGVVPLESLAGALHVS